MTDELTEVKNELETLKRKYKNKSDVVKRANKKIAFLEDRCKWHRAKREECVTELVLLRQLTAHIETFVYEIRYKYYETTYREPRVSLYGTRWIKEGLIIHLAEERQLCVSAYEIEILEAKKLW